MFLMDNYWKFLLNKKEVITLEGIIILTPSHLRKFKVIRKGKNHNVVLLRNI